MADANTRPDFSALFEAVKACDPADVFRRLGYNVRHDLKLEPNPLRDERTPSLGVVSDNRAKWYDHGTREGGDLIDFLQATGLDVEAARLEAAQILGVPTASSSSAPWRAPGGASLKSDTAKLGKAKKPQAADYTRLVDAAHEALLLGTSATAHRARAYLKHRGFDLDNGAADLIRLARVGVIDETVDLPDSLNARTYRDRIVFPYLEANGAARFFNARAAGEVEPGEKFRKPTGANQARPFLRHALPDDADFVILVEAELDALSVLAALGPDAPVLAAGGGQVRPEHLEDLDGRIDQALLLYDADEAGESFSRDAEKALEGLGMDVRRLALPDGVKDANAALKEYGPTVFAQHLKRQIAHARRTSDAAYITTTYLEELARRHERPHVAFATGLAPIDQLLGGGYQEGLHVLGGITGGGKTSFALRTALMNALDGRTVLYATFEQSKHELWSRLAAAVTRIPYGALKRGTYQDRDGEYPVDQVLRQHQAFEILQRASEHLIVLEAGDALSRRDGEATIDDLRKIAERVQRDTGAAPLVVIDYLQRVPGPSDTRGRDVRERVGAVAGFLQVALARDLGTPVLALSSLSRAAYGLSSEKSTIEDGLKALKESGEVEYTAYTVGLLYGFPKGTEPPGLVPVEGLDKWRPIAFRLAKNREGDTGEALLRWTPRGDEWAANQEKKVAW
jgi:replicative DNA helicase